MRYSIKELITEKISGEWGSEPVDGEGIKVIRTTNFTNFGIINYEKIVVRDIDKQKVDKKHLKNGDIIIEKSGGSPAQPVGRVVFFDLETEEKVLCNNFTTILRPNNNLVVPKYLLYQLYIAYQRGLTKKYQNKTTGIINLQLDKYLETAIEVPSIAEQLHITNLLTKAENLISQRKKGIRLLDEFLKSTFLEMFGDPVRNDKGWEINSLSKFGSLKNGLNYTRAETGVNIHCLGVGDFKALSILTDIKSLQILSLTTEPGKEYFLKDGDLVFVRSNGNRELVGRCLLVFPKSSKVTFSGFCIRYRIKNAGLHPFYLSHLFRVQIFRSSLLQGGKGANIQNISQQTLEKLKIPIPPVELQAQFAQIVEKTEILKIQYQQSLQELETLYSSLSQKAFNGM